jgi:hypothetical protein
MSCFKHPAIPATACSARFTRLRCQYCILPGKHNSHAKDAKASYRNADFAGSPLSVRLR